MPAMEPYYGLDGSTLNTHERADSPALITSEEWRDHMFSHDVASLNQENARGHRIRMNPMVAAIPLNWNSVVDSACHQITPMAQSTDSPRQT